MFFRIQQQRLINVPQNYPRYQENDQNPNTQRILSEIQRINVEFGYTKREPQISPRIDLESYFYPRPAYHPIHQRYNNGMALTPTIRQLDIEENQSAPHPFNTQTYFYPVPYLQVPFAETGQLFQRNDKSEKIDFSLKEKTTGYTDNDLFEYAPQAGFYGKLVRDYNQEKALIQAVKKIVNEMKEANKSQQLDTAIIITNLADESRASHKKLSPSVKKEKIAVDDEDDSVVINVNRTKDKLATTTPQSSTISSKTFFSRPKPTKTPSANTNLHWKTTESPQVIVNNNEAPTPEFEDPAPSPSVKGPFSNFINSQKEQVVEALRHGGIIIQRLRVREGGIAIAGPGGVATAGSGGTAIVGPGGIALTHPRSLAIAGPGAKVIAVPESVDLERLALRSNARQMPTEGVVVATGPVIYYNPATAT